LYILAVLERVGQGIYLRKGQGTKNIDKVTSPRPTANAPFSSCKNETSIKMRETLSIEL
jgi:hypothetical protein